MNQMLNMKSIFNEILDQETSLVPQALSKMHVAAFHYLHAKFDIPTKRTFDMIELL